MNKDPSSWTRVHPEVALDNPTPSDINLLQYAIDDIAELERQRVEAVNDAKTLRAALARMIVTFKPFTLKPVGAPGSLARAEQDDQIECHAAAKRAAGAA